MKKLLSIIAIGLMFLTSIEVHSQALVKLVQGTAADTLKKSETHYTTAVNLNFPNVQTVSLTIAVDSISGAPAGSFILQHSVDGVHWLAYLGDTLSYTNTGWNIAGAGSTGDTKSYITKNLNVAPFYGAYARVKSTTTSATQKSRYWITLKSSNYRNQ